MPILFSSYPFYVGLYAYYFFNPAGSLLDYGPKRLDLKIKKDMSFNPISATSITMDICRDSVFFIVYGEARSVNPVYSNYVIPYRSLLVGICLIIREPLAPIRLSQRGMIAIRMVRTHYYQNKK